MTVTRSHLVTTIVVGITTTTHKQNLTVPAITNTWGADFAHVHFFSERGDPALGIVQVANDPTKARASAEELATLKHLADTYPDSPWYYKADDDAYMHASWLADLAARHDPHQPWYIGQELAYTRPDGTTQKYCAGGVGYLISNALMKRIAHALTQPIESCCSDVQVGTLVQRALHLGDGDQVCATPPAEHTFYAAGNPVRPAGFDTVFGLANLQNLVVDDSVRHMLQSGVGFHYVTPVEQYVVRSLYSHEGESVGLRSRHERHHGGHQADSSRRQGASRRLQLSTAGQF